MSAKHLETLLSQEAGTPPQAKVKLAARGPGGLQPVPRRAQGRPALERAGSGAQIRFGAPGPARRAQGSMKTTALDGPTPPRPPTSPGASAGEAAASPPRRLMLALWQAAWRHAGALSPRWCCWFWPRWRACACRCCSRPWSIASAGRRSWPPRSRPAWPSSCPRAANSSCCRCSCCWAMPCCASRARYSRSCATCASHA